MTFLRGSAPPESHDARHEMTVWRIPAAFPCPRGKLLTHPVAPGLPARGSFYFRRLPEERAPVAFAGFVPTHGGGTASVSHRLPLTATSSGADTTGSRRNQSVFFVGVEVQGCAIVHGRALRAASALATAAMFVEQVRPSGYRRDSRLEIVVEGDVLPDAEALGRALRECLVCPPTETHDTGPSDRP